MKIVGVIPARWASTRFEGKVLAKIKGKPMIQHVWERAQKSRLLDDVIIACDNQDVFDTAKGFGANTVLTSADHASGTDRIAEAVSSLECDIVVNIQGDEPMIEPAVIDDVAQALVDDPSCQMATVIKHIETDEELNDPNVVKAVIDQEDYALYFSRSPIPENRFKKSIEEVGYFKHLGIYAYRKEFLLSYHDLPASELERSEKLEQLRALEAGYKIKTVTTDVDTIGVDTPEDLDRVEKLLN